MSDQTIILMLLILAVGGTLWLYILKAKKQVEYKGDERWSLIQLKANNAAHITEWILILLVCVIPLFVDEQATFTYQRVQSLALIYIGSRNLIELAATMYFDRQL